MEPQQDQLCASLIEQVIKVSDDYVRSKTQGGKSRAASVIPISKPKTNETAALKQILFKGSCSRSRAASIIRNDNTNELTLLRKYLFHK